MVVLGKIVNSTAKKYWQEAEPEQQPPDAVIKITFHHHAEEAPKVVKINVPPEESKPLEVEFSGGFLAGARRLKVEMIEGELKSYVPQAVFIGSGGTQSPTEEKLVIVVVNSDELPQAMAFHP